MISGTVNDRLDPVISLEVQGPAGQRLTVDAIVDTGYSGFLTLPPALIGALRLPRVGRGDASLADGNAVEFDVFRGLVNWDGRMRLLDIDEADTTPLVGMAMLEHRDLRIEVVTGGAVSISRR